MNEKPCKSLVVAREGGRCARCGGIGRSYHHRKKRSQGGEWTPENIVLLCGSGTTGCHGWVEENPNAAEKEGWHVRPWQEPEEVPIKWQRTEWLLLLPDGGTTDANPAEDVPEAEAPVREDRVRGSLQDWGNRGVRE